MSDLERTRQYLNEAFQSGAITCLICIASVKRTQAVRHSLIHTHPHTCTYSGVNIFVLSSCAVLGVELCWLLLYLPHPVYSEVG